MTLPAFVELMSNSPNGARFIDSERGIEIGTDRVKEGLPQIETNETQNLGVILEDDKPIYLGIVQKLHTEGGSEKVVVGSVMNTMLKNRVTNLYLYTVFNDHAMAALLDKSRTLVDRTITANE